jgi:hypothetical protein
VIGSLRQWWAWRCRPKYLCAAHYFSDGWPLDSLLIMRQPQLRRDFRQLRADGFNTIILVVPWRGVQEQQSPPAYDDFYFSQLDLVLTVARRHGLKVMLRLAYTHQVMLGPSINGIRFAQELLTDPQREAAWLHYHETLAAFLAGYRSFAGAFVSWEELWHAFGQWQQLSAAERRQLADSIGFLRYARQQGLEEIDAIPRADAPEQAHFLAFANARIRQLFEAARKRFPGLGVEYRVDRDPVPGEDGTQWRANDDFQDFEPARYAYWAPFMGAQNTGEAIDVSAALRSLESTLAEGTQEGSLPGLVLEQFNFIDSTHKYRDVHARIGDEGVNEFLLEAATPLETLTSGYGLWAPRDYRCNLLYNAALLNGGRGWAVTEGSSAFARKGGVKLARGGTLEQQLQPKVGGARRAQPFDALTLRIHCSTGSRVALRARVNRGPWSDLRPEKGRADLSAMLAVDFDGLFGGGLHFELENRGAPLRIERLFLYHHSYFGGVRDSDGAPGPHLEAIRALNERLIRDGINHRPGAPSRPSARES